MPSSGPVQIAARKRSKAVDFRFIGDQIAPIPGFFAPPLSIARCLVNATDRVCVALDAHFEARGFDQRQTESGVNQNVRNAPSPLVE
jgi:hypothetical protein